MATRQKLMFLMFFQDTDAIAILFQAKINEHARDAKKHGARGRDDPSVARDVCHGRGSRSGARHVLYMSGSWKGNSGKNELAQKYSICGGW